MKHRTPIISPRGLSALLVLLAFILLPIPVTAQGGAYDHGLLWKIEGGGAAPSYLFGTMHSSDPQIATPPQALRRLLDSADSLTIEVIIDAQVQMELTRSMLLPDGVLLGDIAGPELLQRGVEIGALYGLPGAAVQRFKPWALYTIFSLPPSEMRRQAAGGQPLDKVLEAYARERGIPVHGLEAPEEQIAALAGYSQEEQLVLLDVTLAQHARVEEVFADMEQAYVSGDLARLSSYMDESLNDLPPELMRDFGSRLVAERNRVMAERMAPRLAEGNALIAVGALHLYGGQGIPALLAAQGYTVTPVE